MQKITPFLWYDNNAEEAMNFYTSIFKNSRIGNVTRYGEAGPGPKGTVMSGTFQLEGQGFYALNGGPHHKFTPAISFFVNCATQKEIDELWGKLSEGGMVLMELDKYPFSEKFGWLSDKYGLSWQLNLGNSKQKITPCLMYVGKVNGKAEEAMNHYVSIFKNSGVEMIDRYKAGEGDTEGNVKHAEFSLSGEEFMALESGLEHNFTFTEAISLFVDCRTQEEVDELWEKLSAGGEKSQCGWLKDKYGVSWQIIPSALGEMLGDKDPAKANRVMQAMLKMQKIDIQGLKRAYEGR